METGTPPHRAFKREIELDFIRGIAILMVLDFHAPHSLLMAPFEWLGFPRFGWAGVDVFFVLSGFLVGGLLVREWKLRQRIDAKHFLIRRGFKIWPQYYFFLVLMLLTGHRDLQRLWGNLLNIQNYVGGVAHTWTLAVEEHAYLLLAAAMAIAASRGVRMRTMFVSFAIIAAAVVALRFLLAAHGYNTFTRTDTRIDGIFYGVMLAILYHYRPETFTRLQSWRWLWVLIVALALTCFRFTNPAFWGAPLSWLCADAMGVALMMLLYRRRVGKKRSALYRLVAWSGLYSYGIYLWHVSVIAPMVTASHYLPPWLRTPWELSIPIAGILVGALTTKVVEFPSLRLRDRLFPRRVDSAVGNPAEAGKKGLEIPPSEPVRRLKAAV
jgi:peptidoglycan/LPS O-acetylase OafA/YrhL